MSVILSIDEYETLLEDIEDLDIVAERRDEPTISHEDLEAKLRADELLKVDWKRSAEKEVE